MSLWREDYTTSSLEEVLGSQAENRAWNKELRQKTNLLVNNRLANVITQEDYMVTRKAAQEDAAECRRRASLLEAQVVRRTAGLLPRRG
jgi:hypothetical protein